MAKQMIFETNENIGYGNGGKKKGGGPPNRMNDLVYRDWMKFQKSFFRYDNDQNLVESNINFFTKSVWPDGKPSKSLLIGFDDIDISHVLPPRIVRNAKGSTFNEVINFLQNQTDNDFILIDLRNLIKDQVSLDEYLTNYSNEMMGALRHALIPLRYCGLLVNMPEEGGGGFPIPWSVGMSCRENLRLRDEKIGLIEDKNRLLYCIYLQADKDERPSRKIFSTSIILSDLSIKIPGWTIPKPPPRKKNEVLHPAKYPETLVSEFIELFTKPGETILDPMVGTGSSIVAAIRSGRNGYGIDLMPEFVEISQNRINEELKPSLFESFLPSSKGFVFQGDSTKLTSIQELANITFDYAVTSPPYWSMLTNPGSENQEKRRKQNLRLVYSENESDLGNVQDYEHFLDLLESVYNQVALKLKPGGGLTVVVKNVKRDHIVFPLAWDIVYRLCKPKGMYKYAGTTFWCQDDVGIKPFAVGIHWVSNTLHHYCLHFTRA